MRYSAEMLTFVIFSACAPSDGIAAWALDPIVLQATDSGVYGFQTWEFYADGRGFNEKSYVCAAVVEITGDSAEPCDGCTDAWEVSAALLESDCDASLSADPGLLTLSRLAIGPGDSSIFEDDPHPGLSLGGFADYGSGEWLTHGWAYPQSLDVAGEAADGSWGSEPFLFWPAWAWQLE